MKKLYPQLPIQTPLCYILRYATFISNVANVSSSA